MNIICLGCSWTADRNGLSWPRELASECPDHTVFNFAWSGTSVLFSLYMLEKTLSSKLKVDKIIFQITSDARVTLYKDFKFDIDKMMLKDSENYYKLKDNDNFWAITPSLDFNVYKTSSNHLKWKFIESFSKSYYSGFEQTMHFDLEYKIQCDYIKRKSDLCFFHKGQITADLDFTPKNIVSIYNEINNEQLWQSFLCDEGSHFNKNGCRWQAERIKEILNL